MTEIRIVITGSSAGAEKAIDSVQQGLDGLQRRGAEGPIKIDKALQSTGESARQTAQDMRNLSFQLTDIGVGLATGQNPFYVLLQQGGQLKDTFGGVLPALRAVASVFTVVRVATGGAAAAIGAFAVAAYQGTQQLEELNRTQRLSGSGAAKTAGEFYVAADRIAQATGNSVANVRDLAVELQKMGTVGGVAFNSTLQAMSAYQKASGATAEDAAKLFSGLSENSAAWAAKQNRDFNFVTAAQVEHLKQLQAMGLKQQAADEAARLFADNLQTKVEPSLTLLGRALQSTGKFFSDFWQAAKDTGRQAINGETPEERLQRLQERVDLIRESRNRGQNRGPIQSRRDAEVEAELRSLQTLVGASKRARDQLASQQAADQQEIERNEAGNQASLASLQKAGIDLRLQQQVSALDQAQRNTDTSYRQGLIDETQYQDSLLQIELAGIKAREDALRASQAADNAITPDSPQGAQAAQARNLQYQRQLNELQAQRVKLLEDEASGQRNQPATRPDSPLVQQFEAEDAALQALYDRRFNAALQAREQLVDVNQELGASLIADERARAQALLDLQLQRVKKSLDLDLLSEEERKASLDRYNEYALAKQQELNDSLKPLWQKQLEDWRDTAALTKKATDDMLNDVLQNSEDAWAQFARTGRLSLDQLVQDFIAAQARLAFRKFVSSAADSILGFFGVALGAGGAGPAGVASGTGRATGGDVQRGRIYEINERGAPETLSVGGRDYLMTGSRSGRVTAAPKPQRAITINQQIVNNIDSRTDQAQIAQIVGASVEEGRRRTYDELTAARVIGG